MPKEYTSESESRLRQLFPPATALFGALFSEDEAEKERAKQTFKDWFSKSLTANPGFFTPYKSMNDFRDSLISPISYPLIIGIGAGIAAIAAAVGTIVCIGSLLITAGAGSVGLFNEDAANTAKKAAMLARFGALAAISLAISTTVLLILTAISIPLAVTAIFTRSGATVISALSDFSASESNDDEQNSAVIP